VRYFGREEKHRLVRRLAAKSGIERSVVEFGIFGGQLEGRAPTTGGNRNATLLAAMDQLLLSVDDDTVCRTVRSPDARNVVGLAEEGDWYYRHYADRDSAVAAAPFVDLDLVGAHERLLGHPVRSLLIEEDGEDGAATAPGSSDTNHVGLTLSGAIGDHGSERAAGVLHLRGSARQRLLESREHYQRACRSRDAIKLVGRPIVVHPSRIPSAFHMAYNLGLDGRRLLPPFFPVGRNEEPLFATLLGVCRPGVRAGVVPVAILHDAEPRPYFAREDVWRTSTGVRICELVHAVVQQWVVSHRARGVDQLAVLGTYLVELASQRLEDYRAFIRDRVREVFDRKRLALESELEETSLPDHWREDACRQRDVLLEAATRSDFEVPRDLGFADADAAHEKGRDMVRDFGRLLESWSMLSLTARGLLRDEQEGIVK